MYRHYAQCEKIDLVVIRYDESVSVLYGRCLHRGALLSGGKVEGDNFICGLHHWDYRIDTEEIQAYQNQNPPPFNEKEYLGKFTDTHPEATEPYTQYIQHLAKNGLPQLGKHGATEAMGVDRDL